MNDSCRSFVRPGTQGRRMISTMERYLSRTAIRSTFATVLVIPLLLAAACKKEEKSEAPVPRPVRTVTVKPSDAGETVTLTGHVDAQDSSAMAFRISGRMTERFVNVGDVVKPGQELARLDPQNELNALRGAQAQQTA